MPCEIVPLTQELLEQIDVQQAQAKDAAVHSLRMPNSVMSGAAIVAGRPVAAAGIQEMWPGRGHAWALLGRDAGPHLLDVTRATRRALDCAPFRRVEITVDKDFHAAIRWAILLGFRLETPRPMRGYTPDGRACYLFARVKDVV